MTIKTTIRLIAGAFGLRRQLPRRTDSLGVALVAIGLELGL